MIIILSLIWGGSWTALKVSVALTSPLFVAVASVFPSILFFIPFCWKLNVMFLIRKHLWKYMLLGLMKSLSSEYKTSGINFNAISPSMMDTPFIKKLGYKFIELNKYLSSSKGLLEIDDVVSKITFLMSSKSDDLNGVNIPLTKSK
ncbi:SDR family oxidoreductase [Croceibacter atlanticus]|uniref:SDR family oxidoreductase n=1 Tax=Croceibacter atlanticus TaxID=313588 RepID=UPI0032B22394